MNRSLCISALLAIATAVQAQVVHRPDVDLPYAVIGEGRPVVLLSGGPGFSTDYEMNLVKGCKVKGIQWILLEQRGTPKARLKQPSEASLSLDQYIGDLEALRTQLHLEKWTVVGHSWGSVYAHEYLARYPKRVNGVVFLGDVGPDATMLGPAGDNIDHVLNDAERAAEDKLGGNAVTGPSDDQTGLDLFLIQLPGMFYSRAAADKARPMFPPGCLVADTENYVLPALMKNNWDVSKAIRRYKGPALILQGRQDFVGETPLWKDMIAMPQARGVFVEKAGHMPWLEQPEAFFKTFDAFLAGIK